MTVELLSITLPAVSSDAELHKILVLAIMITYHIGPPFDKM